MIRAILSLSLCSLCLGLGLESARLQSENYAKAGELDEIKRTCDLIEAGNEGLRHRIHERLAEIERDVFVPIAKVSDNEEVQASGRVEE